MVPAHPLTSGRRLAACLLLAGLSLAACSGDDDGDLAAFCRAVTELREQSPFEDLAVASPGEMRDAFDALQEASEGIAEVAPPATRTQADRYAGAVDELVDELSGAGFDPRRLNTLRYQEAIDRYREAARSLDNAADGACPGSGGT